MYATSMLMLATVADYCMALEGLATGETQTRKQLHALWDQRRTDWAKAFSKTLTVLDMNLSSISFKRERFVLNRRCIC